MVSLQSGPVGGIPPATGYVSSKGALVVAEYIVGGVSFRRDVSAIASGTLVAGSGFAVAGAGSAGLAVPGIDFRFLNSVYSCVSI